MASQHHESPGTPPQPPPPPPPQTPSSPSTWRTRRSRFTEQPMTEYTPANSIYEEDVQGPDHQQRRWRLTLRLANGLVHLAACLLLLVVMATFLAKEAGVWFQFSSPLAITLTLFLGLDSCLDLVSILFLAADWRGWALIARLLFGTGYLAVFMVYVAHGHVFTIGYAFWNLDPGYAGPVVYLFLWLLGIWNLLHTALHRHQLGVSLRQARAAVTAPRVIGFRHSHGPRDLNPAERTSPSRQVGEGSSLFSWPRIRPRPPVSRSSGHVDAEAQHEMADRTSGMEASAENKTVSVTTTSSRSRADVTDRRAARDEVL